MHGLMCALRCRRIGATALLMLLGVAVSTVMSYDDAIAESPPEQQVAEQHVAERFAPIVQMKKQKHTCDSSGDAYFPTTVDWLFNNQLVVLRRAGNGTRDKDEVLKQGPSAQDLVTAGSGTYLDFFGDPRNPGCMYEKYFKQMVRDKGLKPTTYAHFVYDPLQDRLYLQYWFYYYFNDWNNTHESDWEMMTLVFNADSAKQVMDNDVQPLSAGYAQHEGGERSDWDDEKLNKSADGRPFAYVAVGSHATYYDEATTVGWGKNGSAIGCDVTTGEHVELPLSVVLVPETIDPTSPMAWALFDGKWGQRVASKPTDGRLDRYIKLKDDALSGPSGPNTKKSWSNPSASIDTWRDSTQYETPAIMPMASSSRPFCWGIEHASNLVHQAGWKTALALVSVLAFVVGFVSMRTYLPETVDAYGSGLRTFLGIGLVSFVASFLSIWAATKGLQRLSTDWLGAAAGRVPGKFLASAIFILLLQQSLMHLFAAPAVVAAMKEVGVGNRPGFRQSFRTAITHVWPIVPCLLVLGVPFLLLPFVGLLGWLIAFVVFSLFQFYLHAVICENCLGVWASLRRSFDLSKGRLFSVIAFSLGLQILGFLPGTVAGVTMLVAGGSSVSFANWVAISLYIWFVPLWVICLSLKYRELEIYARRLTNPNALDDAQVQPAATGAVGLT